MELLYKNSSTRNIDSKKEYEQCELDCTGSYNPDLDQYLINDFSQKVAKIVLCCVLLILLLGTFFLCRNNE